MIQISLAPTTSPLKIIAKPSGYSEPVRQHMLGMPGISWHRGLSAYVGPPEAFALVCATLEAAGVIEPVRTVRLAAPINPVMCDLPTDRLPEGMRGYQEDGVAWCVNRLHFTGGALLADDMGLGKTLQAIATADALLGPTKPRLILCPAIVAPHWRSQAALWSATPADMWDVMSYGKFLAAHKAGKPPRQTELVVLDEAHVGCSNPKAKTYDAIHEWLAPATKRLALTGTPMTARVSDMWGVLDTIHPGRWGNLWQFQKRYCGGHHEEIRIGAGTKNIWVADGSSNVAELHHRLQHVMLRRLKTDVAAELPARTRTVIDVEVAARAETKKRRKELGKESDRSGQSAKIADLLANAEVHKLEAAAELARECIAGGGRPLLLTLRRENADRLGNMLMCPVAHGDTNPSERRDILLSGDGAAVSTIYSVTTGIDLVEFDTIIFVGLDWVPSTILQAESRIHRLNQKKACQYYYLCALGTTDEYVKERVITRLDTFAEVTGTDVSGGFAASLRGGTEEELLAAIVAAVLC